MRLDGAALLSLCVTTHFCLARVLVAGSTGYIGRNVVQALIQRNIAVTSLVRPATTSSTEYLNGSRVVVADPLDPAAIQATYNEERPSSTICCISSRSGTNSSSWAVDYGAGVSLLRSQASIGGSFVLLSAFCCQKPKLQYQFAKLRLENEIKATDLKHYTIVRPTAYFKSLDGQFENARNGKRLLHFGSGDCAANPISEVELAEFLVDCAVHPEVMDAVNVTRNIGGPDVPPISKLQQLHMMYDALQVPSDKRCFLSLSIGLLDGVISVCEWSGALSRVLQQPQWAVRAEDAAEIARIVRYYATEPMVATGNGEVVGRITLADHYRALAKRGGAPAAVDPMTTTSGALEKLVKGEL